MSGNYPEDNFPSTVIILPNMQNTQIQELLKAFNEESKSVINLIVCMIFRKNFKEKRHQQTYFFKITSKYFELLSMHTAYKFFFSNVYLLI